MLHGYSINNKNTDVKWFFLLAILPYLYYDLNEAVFHSLLIMPGRADFFHDIFFQKQERLNEKEKIDKRRTQAL